MQQPVFDHIDSASHLSHCKDFHTFVLDKFRSHGDRCVTFNHLLKHLKFVYLDAETEGFAEIYLLRTLPALERMGLVCLTRDANDKILQINVFWVRVLL